MVGEILFHLARKIFSKEVSQVVKNKTHTSVDGTKRGPPRNPYATALGELDGLQKN